MADINTKFDIGDRGWFFKPGEPRTTLEGEVKEINIFITDFGTKISYSVEVTIGNEPVHHIVAEHNLRNI